MPHASRRMCLALALLLLAAAPSAPAAVIEFDSLTGGGRHKEKGLEFTTTDVFVPEPAAKNPPAMGTDGNALDFRVAEETQDLFTASSLLIRESGPGLPSFDRLLGVDLTFFDSSTERVRATLDGVCCGGPTFGFEGFMIGRSNLRRYDLLIDDAAKVDHVILFGYTLPARVRVAASPGVALVGESATPGLAATRTRAGSV